MKKRVIHRDKGFTLIEMILVMSIILTLAAISFGVMLVIVREDTMTSTGQMIEIKLLRYSHEAKTRRTPFRIIFDFGRASMRIYSAGADGRFESPDEPLAGDDDRLEEEYFLPKGMYFSRAIITLEEAGNKMPPSDPDAKLPDPNEYDRTGAILLHKDRYFELQKIIPFTGEVIIEGGGDETLDVPETEWLASVNADIIVRKIGEPKSILIDLKQLGGKVSVKVDTLKPAVPAP